MKRKIIMLMVVSVCAVAGVLLCPVVGWAAASDRAALAKQAERMCIKKQFAEAEAVYVGLLDGAEDSEERFGVARRLAAVLAAQEGKQALAKAAVEGILSDYADHARLPHAIHEIAESCGKFGKAKKAKDIYAQILADQPGRSDAIWLVMGQAIADTYAGDEDGAWANTEKLLNNYQGDSRAAESVAQVAWANRKVKSFENARELYQSVLDTWPENERAIYSQRGVILASIELKDPNAAQAATAKLFAEYSGHEDFVGIVSNVAEAYRGKYEYKKSRDLHKYIVENYPDGDEAMWSQRSIVLASVGLRDQEAIDAGIEKLLKDFSGHKDIGKAAYQIARKLNRQNDVKAEELYEYVVKKDGKGRFGALARVNLGGVKLRSGDEKGARKAFDDVLEDLQGDDNLPEAAHLVAEAYFEQARYEEREGLMEKALQHYRIAQAEFQRIIDQIPEAEYTTAWAHYFGAECAMELGRSEQAAELFQTVSERWPDYEHACHAQFMVGRVYQRLKWSGDLARPEAHAKMRKAFERVVELWPDSVPAINALVWLNGEGKIQYWGEQK